MLNELSLVVHSLEQRGLVPPARHPRVNPMGKNRDLLVVLLDNHGKPSRVEVVPGEAAAHLFRVEHGSAGSSFPGFNIPTPLRRLEDAPAKELRAAVERLTALGKNKNPNLADHAGAVRQLFTLSTPHPFSSNQEKQFQRSCLELVTELKETVPDHVAGLKNFHALLDTLLRTKPTLSLFAESVAESLISQNSDLDRRMVAVFEFILFGTLDWKKRAAGIGTPEYWKEKAKQDRNTNQPIYLDLAFPDTRCWRVAHSETSALINSALLKASSPAVDGHLKTSTPVEDAFGEAGALQDKFPVGPKVAELGNVKLFSVNTNEVSALRRYKFKGSESFPVTEERVQKMSDALLYLAGEDKRGITCRAIPSAHPGKRDLLVAYLEADVDGEAEARAPLAEMFGGEANVFSDADFQAIAQPVLEMLEGKVSEHANLGVRLLSFCPIDKGKKQISLNRRLCVQDVISAARNWQAGARNAPDVSVWFYDKTNKQSVFRSRTSPCPLELVSLLNRVWSADATSGFSASEQRAFSVADAYDVFFADSPLALQKTQMALTLLMERMSRVLTALGAVKVTREWTSLSDAVRWQSVKAIALSGILLHQLGHYRKDFMHDSISQVGRLLALADALHQQYCKHVRKDETPSQLIGNALFNTALEQPMFALARLAERLTPYQAWARTFKSSDPEAGVGLVKYFLGEIAACTAAIALDRLPERMSDTDKAKLLLGYLADHPRNEALKQ